LTDTGDAWSAAHGAGHDPLTGALQREVGWTALDREMLRAQRLGHRLVIAFVDLERLPEPADECLRRVAGVLRDRLRGYDLLIRSRPDEFVCALAGIDLAEAHERFEQVGRELEAIGASFRLGFADLDEMLSR
jgi:diguanylate cyclase (GGDEF)-like protein